jgi:2-dehydro-3-deoxyphosphogalactonate aldolase
LIYAVGGVGAGNLAEWMAAGIAGVGIGTEIYVSGRSLSDLKLRAEAAVTALGASHAPGKTSS